LKFAVLRTTWANFCGEIRCETAGSVRVTVVAVLIAFLQGVAVG
jgi:hypothetical protein